MNVFENLTSVFRFQSTAIPLPAALTPAQPTVADMLGAHIQYIRCRPYQRLPIIETGIVTGYQIYKNELFLKMQPDNGNTGKWVSEFDFLAYV